MEVFLPARASRRLYLGEECVREEGTSAIRWDSGCAESAESKLSLPQTRRLVFHNINTIFQEGSIEITRPLIFGMSLIGGARKRHCRRGVQALHRQRRRRSFDKKLRQSGEWRLSTRDVISNYLMG